MSHKNTQKRGVKLDYSLRLAFFILASFLLFVSALVYVKWKAKIDNHCANSISCTGDLSGKKEANNKGIFMGRAVVAPNLSEKSPPDISKIEPVLALADATGDNKHIYVDLTNQKLYAYDGNIKVFDFDVSTGKWHPTPTGTFRIHVWLRYTRMTGGDPAIGTYYDLPNVPFTMYFGNDDIPWYWGYSLHGAYWHNNFGHPMSHGCVNMRIDDAEKMYYWTNSQAGDVTYETKDNPGTLITIYGAAPSE